MSKGNPNPVQISEFKPKRFQAHGEVPGNYPLGKTNFNIKLPVDVQEILLSMSPKERVAWMRKTLTWAARTELVKEVCRFQQH